MQRILHNSDNISVSEMLRLYSLFSDKETSAEEPFRPCIKPLIDELSIGCMKNVRYGDTPVQIDLIDNAVEQQKNGVVVCFSGGKDSVATAIKCRDMGYDVKLFHVHGINHSYPDEVNRAKEIADYLGMPLHIDNVKLSGKTAWQENPLKNQVIATMAIDWSDRNGYGHRIALGDFRNDHRERAIFGTNWTDTVEMWNAYSEYIRNDYLDFGLLILFDSYFQTMDIVAKDRKLLEMVQGCIAPMRYRDYWRSQNIAKYGADVLLPHRCGSCWKCCREYTHLADNGILPINENYYKKCMQTLKKKEKEI